MSGDLDKFVLQYEVQLKDSIERLEKLHTKMNKVETTSSKAASNLKEFASGAANEFDRLIPGVSAVASAVKGMGGAFAIAATAVTALGIGIKSVMNLREQMNQQRSDSLLTGLSGARTEDLTRKLSTQGGGYVSREQASEGLRKFFDLTNSSVKNPLDIGLRRKLLAIGVDPGSLNNQTAPLAMLQQLATKAGGLDDAGIQGLARGTGMDIDWLRSLAKSGPNGVSNIGLTAGEVNQYNNGQDDVSKLNGQLQEFHNELNLLGTTLGESVIPGMNGFLRWLNTFLGILTHTQDKQHPDKKYKDIVTPEGQVIQIEDTSPDTKQDQEAKKKDQQTANEAAKKADDAASKGVQTQNAMSFAINMFAGAVQTFSNAVNIQQAWAAWAGEVGKASGIKGASSAALTGGGDGTWQSSQYAAQIKAASQKTGADPQMLYAIMMTESHGKNGQYSETGAGGLMQVTRGNWKRMGGGADVMDPAANIAVGAQIYMDFLKRYGGDKDKALRGYNGNSDPDYLAKVSGHYGAGAVGKGQSRASMQVTAVQQAIAGYLGVDPQQIRLGGVSKGDVRYAVDNLQGGYLNSLQDLNNQLKNPMLPPSARAEINRQIFSQTNGLKFMMQNSGAVIDKARNGDQEITQGRMPSNMPAITTNFTINGVSDPQKLAKEIDDRLMKHFTDLANHYSTAEKG